MDEIRKKEFHDELFELRLQQQFYTMEHNKENPELNVAIRQLKREYARELVSESGINLEGERKNVKH